jgi:hypothetical protein
LGFTGDLRGSSPPKSLTTDPYAISQGIALFLDKIEEPLAGIDDDRARGLACFVAYPLATIFWRNLRVRDGRNWEALVRQGLITRVDLLIRFRRRG